MVLLKFIFVERNLVLFLFSEDSQFMLELEFKGFELAEFVVSFAFMVLLVNHFFLQFGHYPLQFLFVLLLRLLLLYQQTYLVLKQLTFLL